jgi:hypothetical protein
LGAGLLHPIVAAPGCIAAVSDLGDDALKPDLAGMGAHLAPVDLEARAELDVGAVDELLQMRLALDQRQLSQIVAVEIKEVERDQHDLGVFALQFCRTE